MRRMLNPELKIKSKIKDDIEVIYIEDLLPYAHTPYPDFPDHKTIIIQVLAQVASDDGGIQIGGRGSSGSEVIVEDVTNAILTISINMTEDYISINGFGINSFIDLSVTDIETVEILSSNTFDVYVIKP